MRSGPQIVNLIDIFERSSPNDADVLLSEFRKQFLDCPVGRPGSFFYTVLQIVAPTQSSIIGELKLTGSPLQTYRKRV